MNRWTPRAARQASSDDRVRALDLMADGLADVVQQRAAPGDLGRGAQLGRHQPGEMRALDEVVEHVLPIAGAEAKPSQEADEFRVDAERPIPKNHMMRRSSTESALHAKVIVYDRRTIWIGSANSDFRSRRLNTETGLLMPVFSAIK